MCAQEVVVANVLVPSDVHHLQGTKSDFLATRVQWGPRKPGLAQPVAEPGREAPDRAELGAAWAAGVGPDGWQSAGR